MSSRTRHQDVSLDTGQLPTNYDNDLHVNTERFNEPVENHNRLLYCKAVILLTCCCTSVMRAFILHTVKQADPRDGEEYTLRRFLSDRKMDFYKHLHSPNTGRRQLRPDLEIKKQFLYTNPQAIEKWDLSLLSFVVTRMCKLSSAAKTHFDILYSIRILLFHDASCNGELHPDSYEHFVDQLKAAFDNVREMVDDKETQQKLGQLFNETVESNTRLQYASCKEELDQISDWEKNDNPSQETMDMPVEGLELTQKLIQGLVDEKRRLKVAPEIHDVDISINVKNVGVREERFIIKTLSTHLHRPDDVVTVYKRLPDSDSLEAAGSLLDDVGPAIEEAFRELLSSDREIADVQYGYKVRVTCHSYEGLKELVMKTIKGEITKVFKTVEQKIHLYPGFEKAEFEVKLTDDDYCRFITTLASTQGSSSASDDEDQPSCSSSAR